MCGREGDKWKQIATSGEESKKVPYVHVYNCNKTKYISNKLRNLVYVSISKNGSLMSDKSLNGFCKIFKRLKKCVCKTWTKTIK